MRDDMQWLRDCVKDSGYKHWRVTYGGGRVMPLTAYKTSEYGVQYTLRGKARELWYTIEHIETGLRA